jgi:hypothetical protein
LRLNLSTWTVCVVCLLNASLSLTSATTTKYHNLLPWMIKYQVYMNAIFHLSKCGQFGCVFPSGDVQENLWMLRCRNIVLLTIRFLDVAKFTTLTPLSLLISDLGISERKILKWILEQQFRVVCIGHIWLRIGAGGSCEHGNKVLVNLMRNTMSHKTYHLYKFKSFFKVLKCTTCFGQHGHIRC